MRDSWHHQLDPFDWQTDSMESNKRLATVSSNDNATIVVERRVQLVWSEFELSSSSILVSDWESDLLGGCFKLHCITGVRRGRCLLQPASMARLASESHWLRPLIAPQRKPISQRGFGSMRFESLIFYKSSSSNNKNISRQIVSLFGNCWRWLQRASQLDTKSIL